MTIFVGADHQGRNLATSVVDCIKKFTTDQIVNTWIPTDGDDYPYVAKSLASTIESTDKGILFCGSAAGICMSANRYAHLRAAACFTINDVVMARRHEDMNVMCLSAWNTNAENLKDLLKVYLSTNFDGGRHARRIYQLSYLHLY